MEILKKKINHRFPAIFSLFMALSAAMIWTATKFKGVSLLDSPQSIDLDQIEDVYKGIITVDECSLFWYRTFFIVDLFWPIFLLTLVCLLMFKIIEICKSSSAIINEHLIMKIWLISATIAYSLDFTENITYLFYPAFVSKIVVGAKLFAYALVMLFPFVVFEFHVRDGILLRGKQFLRSSYLSLIVIGVIGFLMTLLGQGATIMIHLLSYPLATILGFVLINFLALLISHYPIYLYIKNDERGSGMYSYKMENDDDRPLGIIYYVRKKGTKKLPPSLKVGWDMLGIGLLLTWNTAMVYTLKSSFLPSFDIWSYFIYTGILSIAYYLLRRKKNVELRNDIYSFKNDEENKIKDLTKSIRSHLWIYRASWMLFIIFIVALIAFVWMYQWTQYTNIIAILVSITNLVVFIELRINRSLLRYTGYSKLNKVSFGTGGDAGEFDKEYFKNKNNLTSRGIVFDALSKISHNLTYLKTIRVIAVITVIYFGIVNVCSIVFYNSINPFNILCAYMIVVYSVIVIYIKHLKFHSDQYDHEDKTDQIKRNFRIFRFYIPIGLIISLVIPSILWYNRQLRTLPIIPEESSLSMSEYLDDFRERNPKNSPIVSIASDGGGLKANLWNLLVLQDELERNPDFLNNVLAFSGVSGGAIGLANFLPLNFDNSVGSNKAEIINDIGNTNVLAIDFAGVFMRDWILHNYWFTQNRSRSYYAMRAYQRALGLSESMDIDTYRSYWQRLYHQSGDSIPMLVMNSTSTSHEQGYALSVTHGEEELPNNLDILSHGDGSLSYFNAVSTTNRFPIASPAARIKSKGYFVDGGYFENSGLQVAADIFQRAINLDTSFQQKNYDHQYLDIRNGRSDWARLFIEKFGMSRDELLFEINETQDNIAILQALVSLDKKPELLREEESLYDNLDNNFIAMPYPLRLNDIRNELKGEIEISKTLIDALKENNELVRIALEKKDARDGTDYFKKYGTVTPPLARLLGEPVVFYQRAMVESRFYSPLPQID